MWILITLLSLQKECSKQLSSHVPFPNMPTMTYPNTWQTHKPFTITNYQRKIFLQQHYNWQECQQPLHWHYNTKKAYELYCHPFHASRLWYALHCRNEQRRAYAIMYNTQQATMLGCSQIATKCINTNHRHLSLPCLWQLIEIYQISRCQEQSVNKRFQKK